MTPKEALELIRVEFQRLEFPANLTPEYRLVKQALTELEELKRDIARYFELDCSLTRDGVFHYSFLQTSKLENETIQKCENRLEDEFSELKEKLSKVGKEE